MKKIILVMLLAGMVGCGAELLPSQLEEGIAFCVVNQGVDFFTIETDIGVHAHEFMVTCNNGGVLTYLNTDMHEQSLGG